MPTFVTSFCTAGRSSVGAAASSPRTVVCASLMAPAWSLVGALLPAHYEVMIFEANGIGLFAAHKRAANAA